MISGSNVFSFDLPIILSLISLICSRDLPGAKPTYLGQHDLFVGVIDQVDRVRWTFARTSSTALALGGIDEGRPAEPANAHPSILIDNLWYSEGTGPCTG